MALVFDGSTQTTASSRKDVGWADAELLLQMRYNEAIYSSRSSAWPIHVRNTPRLQASSANTLEYSQLWSHGDINSVQSSISSSLHSPKLQDTNSSPHTTTPHRSVLLYASSTTKHQSPSSRLGKRARTCDDVDGEQTSTLSCKKRRLRRDLVTSRLSRPFSSPASHILNREAVLNSDKGFLRLTAAMNAKRMSMPMMVVPAAAAAATAATTTIVASPLAIGGGGGGNPRADMHGSTGRGSASPRSTGPATAVATASSLGRATPLGDMLRRMAIFNQTRLHTPPLLLMSQSSLPRASSPPHRLEKNQLQLNDSNYYSTTSHNMATLDPSPPASPPPSSSSSSSLYIPRIIAPLCKDEEIDDQDQPSFPSGDQPFLYDDDELGNEFDDDDDTSLDFSVVFGGGGGSGSGSGGSSGGVGGNLCGSAADSPSQPPSPISSPSRCGVGDMLEDAMDDLDGIPVLSRALF